MAKFPAKIAGKTGPAGAVLMLPAIIEAVGDYAIERQRTHQVKDVCRTQRHRATRVSKTIMTVTAENTEQVLAICQTLLRVTDPETLRELARALSGLMSRENRRVEDLVNEFTGGTRRVLDLIEGG